MATFDAGPYLSEGDTKIWLGLSKAHVHCIIIHVVYDFYNNTKILNV